MKDIKQMSNNELTDYKALLEKNFEDIKKQITNLCKELEKIEENYNKANEEITVRQGGK